MLTVLYFLFLVVLCGAVCSGKLGLAEENTVGTVVFTFVSENPAPVVFLLIVLGALALIIDVFASVQIERMKANEVLRPYLTQLETDFEKQKEKIRGEVGHASGDGVKTDVKITFD